MEHEYLRFAPDLYTIEDEVERFIQVCRNGKVPFEATEWADENPKDPAPTHHSWLGWKGEPGSLIRVRCVECGDEKDAWLGDDGRLADYRDKWHYHNDGTSGKTEPF